MQEETAMTTRTVEVHLEELGGELTVRGSAQGLGGAGGGDYRFVARSAGDRFECCDARA